MYAGQVVEAGAGRRDLREPAPSLHARPDGCIPVPGRTAPGGTLGTIPGVVPSLVGELHGCAFRDRCPLARPSARSRSRCAPRAAGQQLALHPRRDRGRGMSEASPCCGATALHAASPSARGLFQAAPGAARRRRCRPRRPQGEVLAIVGESGCGKSTLARMLLGLLAADRGRDLHRRPGRSPTWAAGAARAASSRCSRTPIRRSIRAAASPRSSRCRSRCMASARRPSGARRVERDAGAGRPAAALCRQLPGQLSGGQRQRVAHRPGPGDEPRDRGLRRADLGARCLGAGADPQPAAGPAAGAQASPMSSSATTSRWSSTSRPMSP